MKCSAVRFFATIGVITVILAIGSVLINVAGFFAAESVPAKTILELDLEQSLIENVPDDPVAEAMLGGTPEVLNLVEALHRAAEDERVVGLIARVGNTEMGLGRIQEIRDALLVFREAGKYAVAYAETLGEFAPGNTAYYLASAFDEIYLQPAGTLGLTGLMAKQPFVKQAFDRLGVEPQLEGREEYKTFVNTFTETEFTQAHKEAISAVIESDFRQIVEGIAEQRGLSTGEVRTLAERGPLLAEEAFQAGLVDGLLYRDQVYDKVEKELDEDARMLFLWKYLARAGGLYNRGEAIALIYGTGPIHRGPSQYDLLFGLSTMGSDTLAKAFRDAVDDPQVKAIVFRVDSPGGSVAASETIWRETVRAKEAGKPVIVTMGDTAASGGYYVAMSADKIVAQPGTLTGSIGVLAGKMHTRSIWSKLGITWDSVPANPNADMWSSLHAYSPAQEQRLDAFLDSVYRDFSQKVADGRDMPLDAVQQAAKGRVWTGEDAKRLGLVDALGGFPEAIRLAKEAAGIPDGVEVRLKLYPHPRTWMQRAYDFWLGEGPENSRDSAATAALRETLVRMQPFLREIRDAGLMGHHGALSMQPAGLE